ncbi:MULTISPECIES: SoxR reducing system RseC family protein [Megasphaera]|uniref:Positive regulator of sigma(E), RseC/MucC n=1 Tax=Megasphaera vaginalis (ex Srinivasan et al. 2021) TaxID=1111454 RepID=U7UET2_9FIRM|nr:MULTISPECIES: SoxR reducing system RseC family protein [Megasphaera]ERT57860.1 positive regulator of sigma(E), RseC/MucC [Megasphaera vaginalis (ex Srinivasan et al. 2021)]
MKVEEGTIISLLDNGLAEIKVGRHSDCIACGACDGANDIVVKALNPVGAKVGQHVSFELRETNIVVGAFVCFIMPLLVAVIGAFLGYLAGQNGSVDTVQAEIVGGIAGFCVGLIGVKLFDRSLSNDDKVKPKVIQIHGH